MRFAIVSDIHANLQAWNAVLLDIRSSDVDRIVCLGDLIGYGPCPAETLQSVHANVHHLVLGNHDAALCGKMDPELFNDAPREILAWTAKQVGRNAVRFLESLPLTLAGAGFRCAHGEFSHPERFDYVVDPEDARPSWESVAEPLLFVGHSHRPGIFVLGASGVPRGVEAQDFALEDGKRYLVNVGSVGQPRDGDVRACYCIFDSEARSVCWRRLPFDVDAYRLALRQAGLPEAASYFLRVDPRRGAPPLRELLDFSPARTAAQAARNVVPVQQMEALRRDVRRWKVVALAVLVAAAAGLSALGTAWWQRAHRACTIRGLPLPRAARAAAAGENAIVGPDAPVAAGAPVPGWELRLGDGRRQSVRVERAAGEPAGTFVLRSDAPGDELLVVSEPVPVEPGGRVSMEALFKKAPGFRGNVSAGLSLTQKTDSGLHVNDTLVVKEPNERRKDDWLLARESLDMPAGAQSVQFILRGQFAGEVRASGLRLAASPRQSPAASAPPPPPPAPSRPKKGPHRAGAR